MDPPETMEAGQIPGASSMRDLDRFDNNSERKKFYVVGRARYRPFVAEPEENANFVNVMPLAASDAYDSLVESLGDPFVDLIGSASDEFGLTRETAFKPFIENIWRPGINTVLESQNGLVADGTHTPQITTGGQFCFDVKLLKLMDKRKNDLNLDFNNSVTRTEAVQQVRLLRSKFRQLPNEFMRILFRGPLGPNGEPVGLEDSQGIFADNDVDAPYNLDLSKESDLVQFNFLEDYIGSTVVDYALVDAETNETYAYVMAIIKPGQNLRFTNSDLGTSLAFASETPDRTGTIYTLLSEGRIGIPQEFQGGNVSTEATSEQIAAGTSETLDISKSTNATNGPHALQGGLSKSVDRYASTKGRYKTNRFGTREEIESLTWIEGPEGSAIGLLQASNGTYESPLMIRAYQFGPDMASVLQRVPQKAVLVWVPPQEAGRKDGYFTDVQVPDWALIEPWASQFDVAPMWDLGDLDDAPEDPMQRRTWKLLKACDEGYSEDPMDYGFRGGFIMEIFLE
jgi:hypothetical protein